MNLSKVSKIYNEAVEHAVKVQNILSLGSHYKILLDIYWCIVRYGARPRDYSMFEFYLKNHRARNQYMTIMRYFKTIKQIDRDTVKRLCGSKSNCYTVYKDFIKRQWLKIDKETSNDLICSFIKGTGSVIVKPNHGEQGHGVFKIKSINDDNIKILLERNKDEEFVIEEMIENIPEIKIINPSSLNTVRVYTLTDKQGVCHIVGIMLRVGRKGRNVDNWGSGGIGYNFDLTTGICNQPGLDKNSNPYLIHPESGIQMIGYKLPMWDELMKYIADISKVEPKATYVGWDIALTPKGIDLVEMNLPGGHDFLQVFNAPMWNKVKEYLY